MSSGLADPHGAGSADPGGDTAITGSGVATPRPGDPEHSGLGEGAPGGRLDDLDDSFRRRANPEPQRDTDAEGRLETTRQPADRPAESVAGDVDARRLERSAERIGRDSGDAPFDALSDTADDTA